MTVAGDRDRPAMACTILPMLRAAARARWKIVPLMPAAPSSVSGEQGGAAVRERGGLGVRNPLGASIDPDSYGPTRRLKTPVSARSRGSRGSTGLVATGTSIQL